MFYCLRSADAECRCSKFSLSKFELCAQSCVAQTHAAYVRGMANALLCLQLFLSAAHVILSVILGGQHATNVYKHTIILNFWLFVKVLNRNSINKRISSTQ